MYEDVVIEFHTLIQDVLKSDVYYILIIFVDFSKTSY